MPTCDVKCLNCGYTEHIDMRGRFFGGIKTGQAEYAYCFRCCEAEEPEFDCLEEALVSWLHAGAGRPWPKRKWFAENYPLAIFDTDEEVFEYIDLAMEIRRSRREIL